MNSKYSLALVALLFTALFTACSPSEREVALSDEIAQLTETKNNLENQITEIQTELERGCNLPVNPDIDPSGKYKLWGWFNLHSTGTLILSKESREGVEIDYFTAIVNLEDSGYTAETTGICFGEKYLVFPLSNLGDAPALVVLSVGNCTLSGFMVHPDYETIPLSAVSKDGNDLPEAPVLMNFSKPGDYTQTIIYLDESGDSKEYAEVKVRNNNVLAYKETFTTSPYPSLGTGIIVDNHLVFVFAPLGDTQELCAYIPDGDSWNGVRYYKTSYSLGTSNVKFEYTP